MEIKRRNFLTRLGLGLGAVVTASFESATDSIKKKMEAFEPIIEIKPMGFQWGTAFGNVSLVKQGKRQSARIISNLVEFTQSKQNVETAFFYVLVRKNSQIES